MGWREVTVGGPSFSKRRWWGAMAVPADSWATLVGEIGGASHSRESRRASAVFGVRSARRVSPAGRPPRSLLLVSGGRDANTAAHAGWGGRAAFLRTKPMPARPAMCCAAVSRPLVTSPVAGWLFVCELSSSAGAQSFV